MDANDLTAMTWIKKPQLMPDGEWDLSNARLNLCYNALDRHIIAGRADDAALTYESARTGAKASFTYAELLDDVARAAGVLAALGVGAGESVILCMTVMPQLVVAVLACMRVGAAYEIVSPDADGELAQRLDIMHPKVLIATSVRSDRVTPLPLDTAQEVAQYQVPYRVILEMADARPAYTKSDFVWSQVMQEGAVQTAGCARVDAETPAVSIPKSSKSVVSTGGLALDLIRHGLRAPIEDIQNDIRLIPRTSDEFTRSFMMASCGGAHITLVETADSVFPNDVG